MERHDMIKELMEAADQKMTPKQANIIRAAIEIFAEKGYAATSTSEIANRAGVAEGTIFRHYKTKKELLISIVTPMITRFAAPFFAEKFVNNVFVDENLADMDTLLRELIKERYEFVKQNVPLLKIILQEMAFHPEIQRGYREAFVTNVLPRFKKAVELFKEKGQIGDFPTETVMRLTISTVAGFMIARFIIMPDFDWDDEQEIEYTLRFIRNGLIDG
ncbi:DNA-binding transcriptional regulator, AcrR family [Salinibacillus kushneri]|uniref:DNA-binding transcriptional regulator, AcrR family n=1 Tax=Salinibacillus kushneri TaxID=237682 RepID=A0A1I0GQG5_9BACI|nr:TetR/AcrR family transcriptional regulator [Salinibacillus kushneri]SET73322.1 DNA-binding transcriptional regulator, AcrR family [Salinibacillus kushneri]